MNARKLLIAAIAGCCATFALLVLQAAAPSGAYAGADIHLDVNNYTQVPIKLLGTDNYCWYPHELNQGEAPTIDPKGGKRIYTESKTTFATSCFGADDRWQRLDVSFQRADGSFPAPYDSNLKTADAFPYAVNEGFWELHWPRDPAYLTGIPKGWFPISTPQASSASAANGIFCISAYGVNDRELGINVKDGSSCIGAGATKAVKAHRPPGARPAPAGPAPNAAGNPQAVYNVLQLGRSACELLKPDRPWGADCSEATDGKWDLSNLAPTTQIKNAKPETDPTPVAQYTLLGHDSLPNRSSSDQSFSVGYTASQGEDKSSSTSSGWSFGGNLNFSSELHFIAGGSVGGQIDFSHNWETTSTQSHSKETSVSKSATFTAKPGVTTYGYVFQKQGSLDFNFSADLSTGTPNTVIPIKTPMTRSLGMSAARQHPCIGYLAGNGPGSLKALGVLAASRGYSPATPGLPADQKAFLAAVPGFSVSSTDRCPGYPDGYPAAMAFKGTGFVNADAASGTSWLPSLGDFKYCPYEEPLSQSGVNPPPGTGADPTDPCSGKRPPGTPGTVYDGDNAAPGETIHGSDGGNLILAGGERNLGDATQYHGGGGNDILQGRKYSDPMFGGSGADVGVGMNGADELHGGFGDDSLYGGAGNDSLVDDNGNNGLFGGAGDDRLSSSSGANGGLLGGAGNDMLTMHGNGSVVLEGGRGDDVYRLKDSARARGVAEFPDRGDDKIVTGDSLTLPPNVEHAVARGSNGVTLRAGTGDQTLRGGHGNDALAGGPGSDRVDGQGGDDELRLTSFGFDKATGGSGADRFLVLTKKLRDPAFPVGLRMGKATSAHVITDLHAGRGDRLVLSTANFGKRLGKLNAHMRITEGKHARGHHPQLVFDPRRHLLSFDRDGRHGTPPTVIAILRGHRHVRARAIKVVHS